jgi:carbamoyltransferase
VVRWRVDIAYNTDNMNILGISAFYHDSAAALVRNGEIIGAAQEERFTRKKHDNRFPINSVEYCLQAGGIDAGQLDYVVFYEKPLVKFERLLETYIAYAPRGFGQFLIGIPGWLRHKLHLPGEMDKALKYKYKGRYLFAEHHESHAASAFFPSPFEQAAILTLDGVGEWTTAGYGTGSGNKIELTHEIRFPHSLGLLYSAFTYFTGFKVNSGEYKMMGLAPYGEPKYYDLIMKELIDIKGDGSFRLNMSYFPYCHKTVMVGRKFEKLLGGPARRAEGPLTQREMDIAASVQKVCEEVMLRAAKYVHRQTGMKNLALAGGVALNCVGNGRILREGPFEHIWIQPAASDAGGALGAALLVWYQLLGNERKTEVTDKPFNYAQDRQKGSLLGPAYSDEQIRLFLDTIGAKYHAYADFEQLVDNVADLISQGKVIGWFQDRMEFGPRALGNRSIIGDARSEQMQSLMNLKIKFRESFRPFAPCVLREDVDKYFKMRPEEDSPYMLLVADVKEDKRLPASASLGEAGPDNLSSETLKGLDKLKVRRSIVPAITHVDYSARIQTVDRQRHQKLHRLMSRFKEKTGCPVIINTSFNIRGEPIVCSPEHAYRCFMATDMDVLVMQNQLLYKNEQSQAGSTSSPQAKRRQVDEYMAQFKLD